MSELPDPTVTLENYLKAFVNEPAVTAAGYYDLPYVLIADTSTTVLLSAAEVETRLQSLRAMASNLGHEDAAWAARRVTMLSPLLALVTTTLNWKNVSGKVVRDQNLVYVMRLRSTGWKISALMTA